MVLTIKWGWKIFDTGGLCKKIANVEQKLLLNGKQDVLGLPGRGYGVK